MIGHIINTAEWSKRFVSALRSVPSDLGVLTSYVLVATVVVEFTTTVPPVRAVVVLPLVLFAPGYGVVSVAYPGRRAGRRRNYLLNSSDDTTSITRLTGAERLFLSFGMSIALLPIVGVAAAATVGGISPGVVLISLSGLTLLSVGVAGIRRFRLPPEERFRTHLWPNVRRFRSWLVRPSPGETAVNLLLVTGLLLAVGTLGFGLLVPSEGESFTTATLVTEQGGEYVAAEYPTEFTAGEPQSLTLTLESNERSETTYTVITAVERVDRTDGSISILERSELDRSTVQLRPGETHRMEQDVAPDLVGESLRLSYYVYRGEPAATPSDSSAYRDLHLWIDVESS